MISMFPHWQTEGNLKKKGLHERSNNAIMRHKRFGGQKDSLLVGDHTHRQTGHKVGASVPM